MSEANLWDAHHMHILVSDLQKYCRIGSFYDLSTNVYLMLGISPSVSSAIWKQFIDKVLENVLKRERQNIIMDDAVIFIIDEKHFKDLTNVSKALINLWLNISPQKCQIFEDHLKYMGLTLTLKDGKLSYTLMKEKCNAIINPHDQNYVKTADHSIVWLTFRQHSSKVIESTSYQFIRYRKRKT